MKKQDKKRLNRSETLKRYNERKLKNILNRGQAAKKDPHADEFTKRDFR